jgi:hypothetical protein
LLDGCWRSKAQQALKMAPILNPNHYCIWRLNKLMHFEFMDDIARQAAAEFAIALGWRGMHQ